MPETGRTDFPSAPATPVTAPRAGGSAPPEPAAAPAEAGLAATLIGTLFYAGRFPIAPGTAGSAVAVAIWWAAHRLGGAWAASALGAALAVAGVWAAGRIAAARGQEDPSEVVVDEAAGMFLSLQFLPSGWEFVAAAFVLFRILDVTKPWPAERAERLPGGLGVVADDLVVGLYTNVLLQVAAVWVLV